MNIFQLHLNNSSFPFIIQDLSQHRTFQGGSEAQDRLISCNLKDFTSSLKKHISFHLNLPIDPTISKDNYSFKIIPYKRSQITTVLNFTKRTALILQENDLESINLKAISSVCRELDLSKEGRHNLLICLANAT